VFRGSLPAGVDDHGANDRSASPRKRRAFERLGAAQVDTCTRADCRRLIDPRRSSWPISIIGQCARRSTTLSDFSRPELVRTTSSTTVRDGRSLRRRNNCVQLDSTYALASSELTDLLIFFLSSVCLRQHSSISVVDIGRSVRDRMPPVIEVYNRVVQCQVNQRLDRPGRRRRHFSEQNIKSETPSHNDVSCGYFCAIYLAVSS